MYGRETLGLNGPWAFRPDPDDVGRVEGWHAGPWPASGTVTVPGGWQEHEEYETYCGVAWYRRTFEHGGDGRAFLCFDAVDYRCTVWVNGERVGDSRDGLTPFEVEATDATVRGENTVTLRVVDPGGDDPDIPHGKQGGRWYGEVGGVWGDVTCETRPAVHVADAKVFPDAGAGAARVAVTVDAAGAGLDGCSVTVTASHGDDAARATAPVEDGVAAVELDFDAPARWTPEEPALYDLDVELDGPGVSDTYEAYFGLRDVGVADGEFRLNGEPYPIRGALDQEFYPGTRYRPYDDEVITREIDRAEELGVNLLRKHVKPAHPDFVEAADRRGLLLWEEPANPDRYTERSRRAVRRQLRRLVDRDFNAPSVVAWSAYNEEWGVGSAGESLWDDESKQAYLRGLVEWLRRRDPTRLVCDNSGWAHVETDINDYHEYYVAPDRAGRWSERLDQMVTAPEKNYAAGDPGEAALVVSEFGTWGFPDADALESFYGGEPRWYDRGDGARHAGGYRERFERYGLGRAFDGVGELATAWQRREFVSNKRLIEEMRRRDGVAGYCVTQWSDLEWEFNGLLDYRREPKAFHADYADVNAPVAVALDLPHVAWAGDRVTGDLLVFNDGPSRVEDTVEWTHEHGSGRVEVSVPPVSTVTVEDAVTVDVPGDAPTGQSQVTATLGDRTTAEPLTVIAQADAVADADATAYADAPVDPGALGLDEADDPAGADIAIVTSPEAVPGFAEAGGATLVVPQADGTMADTTELVYEELPREYGWTHAASMLFATGDLGVPGGARLGWEFENAYPLDAVADPAPENALVGSVTAWVRQFQSPLVVRERGAGTLAVSTFRGRPGEHPTVSLLVAALVDRLV
jgi:hypothetical protein